MAKQENTKKYSVKDRNRKNRMKKQYRKRQRRKALFRICILICGVLAGIYYYVLIHQPENINTSTLPFKKEDSAVNQINDDVGNISDYPRELQELLERNPEAEEFVKGYWKRDDYINKPIDLSKDYTPGKVPLLMQWDKRWGYDNYGEDMIGIAGCGPTCLSMACIYLTGDTEKNPRAMAQYAYENGYYTSAGTSWSLWTEGVSGLGLTGEEISLNEKTMKNYLDQGQVIICSMSPGDFTTEGHIILIRGYGKNGFYVNDPNRKSNSEKQWTFEKLKGQIKCLWALSLK